MYTTEERGQLFKWYNGGILSLRQVTDLFLSQIRQQFLELWQNLTTQAALQTIKEETNHNIYHRCRQILKYNKNRKTSSQLLTLNDKSSLQLLFQCYNKFGNPDLTHFVEIALALIDIGADVNQFLNPEDDDELTLLHCICKDMPHETKLLESFLRNGANVNDQTLLEKKPHYTPLNYAVINKSINVACLLLEYEADPNITDMFGQTVLMHTALTEDDKIFSLLLDHNVDVNFHVENGPIALEHALCSENLNKFNTLWDLTDIKLINERLEDILDTMMTCMWYKPDKIIYFYKVLDTPGIILPANFRFLHRLAVELVKLDEKWGDEIIEEDLTKNEFREIDVYGIVKILLEKSVQIRDKDLEGLVFICCQYHHFKLPEKELELLNLLAENNIKITPYVIYFSVANYPTLCTTLLKFCPQCHPIDVFKHIIECERIIDIEVLQLIKELLNLCDPPENLKRKCAAHIKQLFDSKADWVRENIHDPYETTIPLHKMMGKGKIGKSNTQLFNEVYNTLLYTRNTNISRRNSR